MTQGDTSNTELDIILGKLLEATYHSDGKTSTLISYQELARIKQSLLAWGKLQRIDELKRIALVPKRGLTQDYLMPRIRELENN